MSNVLVAWNNRADSATLTADTAFSTSLPITNLSTSNVNAVARTASCKRSATRFRGNLGANYALRAIGIRRHTLHHSAQVRWRVSRSPFDLIFDSEDGDINDSRLTKTGGTNGTRVNKRGVIVRVTRTNYLLRSAEFDNASWTKTNATVSANATTSPENTATMDQILESAAAGAHTVTQAATVTSGAPQTFSISLKAGTLTRARIEMTGNVTANSYGVVNLSTGEFEDLGAGCTNFAIEPNGAGTWRCSVTTVSTGTAVTASLTLIDSANATSYTGSTSNYLYAWGAQLEENGDMTDYIATTTATVTATASGRITYGAFRDNLLKHSQSLTRSDWTKTRSSVSPNETTAPDGTTTACKLIEDTTATNSHFVNQSVVVVNGALYTVSVYLKAAERTVVDLITASGAATFSAVSVNLSAGTIAAPKTAGLPSAVASSTITSEGDGWYRVAMNFSGASGGFSGCQVRLTNGTTDAYTGDGSSGVYVWGGQIERSSSSSASAYIATTFLPRTVVDTSEGASTTGLLVEEARTNLLLQSAFAATWTASTATLTARAALSSEFATTAASLVEDNTNAVHTTQQSVTKAASSIQYTASVYVKPLAAGSARNLKIQIDDAVANGATVVINPATGATVVAPGTFGAGFTAGSVSVSAVGNGWYRVAFDATTNTATTVRVQFLLLSGTSQTYLGDAASGLYLWAAQLEAGAFATSYIPTAAASVTRAADSITVTGANLTGFYNVPKGAIYVEGAFVGFATGVYPGLFSLDDGTGNNAMHVYVNQTTGDIKTEVWVGGVIQVDAVLASGAVAGTAYKAALSYEANNFAACVGGGYVRTDPGGTVPTATTLRIGQARSSGGASNVRVNRLTYYAEGQGHSSLQSLSTSGPDQASLNAYNSGWLDALQFDFYGDTPSDWGDEHDIFDTFTEITARYITVEIDDLYNAAAYLDLGRLYVMGGIEPEQGPSEQGYSESRVDLSSVSTSVTGRQFATERARQRQATFTLAVLSEDEAATVHQLQDDIGVTGECLWVPRMDDRAYSQRYGGLGHLRELGPIEYPWFQNRAVPFQWKEKL